MAASIANRLEQANRDPDWPKVMLLDPRTWPARVLVVLALLLAPLAASADDLADAQRRGATLLRAGKPAEAVATLAKALDLAEARHGPDSPEISADLNNLGEAQRLLGRLDAAEALFRRVIAIEERPGGDPLALATALNNLALVQRAAGREAEAERLYRRSLPLLEGALGPSHPDVAKALNNLAVLYRVRGEPTKARPLQERAVAIAERALGPQHAVTAALRDNLMRLAGTVPPAAAARPGRDAPARGAVPVPRPRPTMAATRIAPAAGPPPAPRAVPAPSPAEGGSALLHLGSVSAQAEVGSEWRRLLRRHPELAALVPAPAQRVDIADKGTFWRVLAAVPAGTDGAALCARIAASGDPCRMLAR